MKNKILKKLEAERKIRIQKATNELLSDNLTNAHVNLEWIDASIKLTEHSKLKSKSFSWSLIIGILSIVIIGLSMIIRIPMTRLNMDISTNDVGFILDNNWRLDADLKMQEFYINCLNNINAKGLGITIVNQDETSEIDLIGNIHFSDFSIKENSIVKFKNADNKVIISIRNDSIVCTVYVDTALFIITTDVDETRYPIKKNIPEFIDFSTNRSVGEPITIQFKDTSDWQIINMLVKNIEFLQEDRLGSKVFESSILSGIIKIPETKEIIHIEKGDIIKLEILKNIRFSIQHKDNNLKIHFEGIVKKISSGPQGYIRSNKPTLIEYLYYQELWAFIWSAIILISGILWSIKKSIFEK